MHVELMAFQDDTARRCMCAGEPRSVSVYNLRQPIISYTESSVLPMLWLLTAPRHRLHQLMLLCIHGKGQTSFNW